MKRIPVLRERCGSYLTASYGLGKLEKRLGRPLRPGKRGRPAMGRKELGQG